MLDFYLLALIFVSSICNKTNNYQNSKNNDTVCRLQARAKIPHLEGKIRRISSYLLDISIDEYHDLDLDKYPPRSSLPRLPVAISLTSPVNPKFCLNNCCCFSRRHRSPSCYSSLDITCLDLNFRARRKP